MYDLGITDQDRYDALMIRYIQKARLLPDSAKQEAARVGLSKELLKESITWKTLLKGFEFLNVKQVDFDICINRDGTVTSHALSFEIGKERQVGKILGTLLAKIFHDLDIRGEEYSALMDAYIEKSRATIHKRQKATIRASVSKELLKPVVTWKTFTKGLVFVGVSQFTIRVGLRHAVKPMTQHTTSAYIDSIEEGDEDGSV